MRWQTADAGPEGLFAVTDLYADEYGSGRMSNLEFLPVVARKVLNHLPNTPWATWTINAYRGCSHACTYCLAPDTAVLTADGRSRRIADLEVGDCVYGTVVRGRYRRYVPTEVRDVWRTVRRAYRVRLADSTELICSGDHRFLTGRGWKHTANAPGTAQRPHLTTNTELLGFGALASPPLSRSRVPYVLEPPAADGVRNLRVTGGLSERLRSMITCDPALTRKRHIDDIAVEARADLRVVSIEDLGIDIPMVDITTDTGDFIANGVVSHNCFARPTHEYLGLDAGTDFDTKIVVKINAVDVLRKELARPGWQRESVAMGTNTDPYQRAEAKFKLTRGIIAALIDADTPFSILTKSPLVTRDLDLIAPAAQRLDVSVTFSIGTIDEHAWRLSEPGAPHPLRRVEAMRAIAAAGVRTGALMAPILPGLSDRPDQLAATARAIEDAGGAVHHAHPVYLRGATREHFMSRLLEHDHDLHARYVRGFDAHGDVSPAYRRWLRETLHRAGVNRS
ncbi:MAG TPA: hypothetical protein VIG48_06110 [Jatrophihabitans sp.]